MAAAAAPGRAPRGPGRPSCRRRSAEPTSGRAAPRLPRRRPQPRRRPAAAPRPMLAAAPAPGLPRAGRGLRKSAHRLRQLFDVPPQSTRVDAQALRLLGKPLVPRVGAGGGGVLLRLRRLQAIRRTAACASGNSAVPAERCGRRCAAASATAGSGRGCCRRGPSGRRAPRSAAAVRHPRRLRPHPLQQLRRVLPHHRHDRGGVDVSRGSIRSDSSTACNTRPPPVCQRLHVAGGPLFTARLAPAAVGPTRGASRR